MTDTKTTITTLAKILKISPEQLLLQFQRASINVSGIDDSISPKEKQRLLLYLRQSRQTTIPSSATQPMSCAPDESTTFADSNSSKIIIKKKKSSPIPINDTLNQDSAAIDETIPQGPIHTTVTANEPDTRTSDPEKHCVTTKKPADENTLSSPEKQKKRLKSVNKEDNSSSKATPHRNRSRQKQLNEPYPFSSQSQYLQGPLEVKDSLLEHDIDSLAHRQSTSGKKNKVKIKHIFSKPAAPTQRNIPIPQSITVANLAQQMSIKASALIKSLMELNIVATINQPINQETAAVVVESMGHIPQLLQDDILEKSLLSTLSTATPIPRAPIVTIMGHVDHGKTSLLDYIRLTKVTASEAGGITQHIGAYHVNSRKGMITFIDTPGHEAFTAMRARGAQCTDIVVLVVAADDGVMPQTLEAIQHAHAANVSMIVAINKIDKPITDIERIKTELSQHGVAPEEWGGDVIFQEVSAKTGQGITALLDCILLQAEMLELKAVDHGVARGIVIESRLDKSRGAAATILITAGQLKVGNILLVGSLYGRIRLMLGDNGTSCAEAGPAIPVEVFGLPGTVSSGEDAWVVSDERKAREIAEFRKEQYGIQQSKQPKTPHLADFFDAVQRRKNNNKLNILLKADTEGSIEAIVDALLELSNDEVAIKIVAHAVGAITQSDAHLAFASQAIIIGFNVRTDAKARLIITNEHIDLHYYSVIYDLVHQVKAALSGLLPPEEKENILGLAEVREVFRSSKLGTIAGCMILEGTMKRRAPIRVLRNNIVIYEGILESLRRFKEDAQEVRSNMLCGIGVKNYNDVKVGDQIETFEVIHIARTLE